MQKVLDLAAETAETISLLLKVNRVQQALVIIYSVIDTMAWANKTMGDVQRSDFIDWVDIYMRPELTLGCTPQDLYGARCALLHSGTTESAMSRNGKAVMLWYVSGKAEKPVLDRLIAKVGVVAKSISFEDLLKAFTDGAARFSWELDSDAQRQRQVEDRICAWLSFVPV
jgi:hypothetical protein